VGTSTSSVLAHGSLAGPTVTAGQGRMCTACVPLGFTLCHSVLRGQSCLSFPTSHHLHLLQCPALLLQGLSLWLQACPARLHD
jgi:hypothetical protein